MTCNESENENSPTKWKIVQNIRIFKYKIGYRVYAEQPTRTNLNQFCPLTMLTELYQLEQHIPESTDGQKFVTCTLLVQTFGIHATHTPDRNAKLKNSYLKFATNEVLLGNYKLNANG